MTAYWRQKKKMSKYLALDWEAVRGQVTYYFSLFDACMS